MVVEIKRDSGRGEGEDAASASNETAVNVSLSLIRFGCVNSCGAKEPVGLRILEFSSLQSVVLRIYCLIGVVFYICTYLLVNQSSQ